jgi:uncharacterized protein YbjQ (UPF0145 family)
MKRIWFLVAVMAVSGCSAHSPMIIKNTVDTESRTTVQYPPTQQKIFVTGERLPADSYDPVARIDVGKIWYGSSQNVLVSLADRARELGADAVIDVKTWHQPSGFSWAAPHGSGLAVKVKDRASLEKGQIPGDWM